MKDEIFRYRIITNLNCNMNESTGKNGNCYFCYQILKSPLRLDYTKLESTLKKVGILKRATIMGGESLLNPDLPKITKLVSEYTTSGVCLVTNGILLNENIITELRNSGLTEVAISISSPQQYLKRREMAILCKSIIPNTRINIPKCKESLDPSLLEEILKDNFYCIVCEDLQARYGDLQLPKGSVKIKDDGYGFYDYLWEGHQFGVFGNYGKYNRSDIIITPLGNFCDWEKYCKAVENTKLVRKNSNIDNEKIMC